MEISNLLGDRTEGLTIDDIEGNLRKTRISLPYGMTECILRLSGQFAPASERWLRKTSSEFEVVSEALERFAEESGRRIFKADKALQGVPPEMKPTVEELEQILNQMGTMELRRNNMIRIKD